MKGFKSYKKPEQMDRQTETQTDITENITYPHTPVIMTLERGLNYMHSACVYKC